MKYVVSKEASKHGFNPKLHREIGRGMILNELEVMKSLSLNGTLEERANTLGGQIYTENELFNIINEEE